MLIMDEELEGLDGSSRCTESMDGLSSTKLKRMELRGKTSQILSDYTEFLADLHGEEGAVGSALADAQFMASLSSDQYYDGTGNDNDGEYRRDFHVGEQAGDDEQSRSWSRDTFNQQNDGLLAVPVNDLFFSHDYDIDRRRYNSFCRSRILLVILILLIALVILLVSLTKIDGRLHGVEVVDGTISSTRPSDQDLYDAINLTMRPKWYNRSSGWSGGTFNDAVEFCSSVLRQPCPYTAYCPAGEHMHPLGGTKDRQQLWSPVSSHEYVSIGLNQTCKFEKTSSSVLDDETSIYIACCEKPHGIDNLSGFDRPPSMEEDLDNKHAAGRYHAEMKLVKARFRPKWYSSSDGWEASTPEEGVRFCKSRASEATLCGYEAYCPGGLGMLYEGSDVDFEDEAVEHWSPYSTIDGMAMSVSVGAESCRTREISGGEFDAPASFVLCCRDINLKSEESDSLAHPTLPTLPTAEDIFVNGDNNRSNYDPSTLTKEEEAVMDYMNPLWYAWDGGTHAEADEFCNQIPGRELCLPEAYCPNNSPEEGDWNAKPAFEV